MWSEVEEGTTGKLNLIKVNESEFEVGKYLINSLKMEVGPSDSLWLSPASVFPHVLLCGILLFVEPPPDAQERVE